jgi:hypothetical protein
MKPPKDLSKLQKHFRWEVSRDQSMKSLLLTTRRSFGNRILSSSLTVCTLTGTACTVSFGASGRTSKVYRTESASGRRPNSSFNKSPHLTRTSALLNKSMQRPSLTRTSTPTGIITISARRTSTPKRGTVIPTRTLAQTTALYQVATTRMIGLQWLRVTPSGVHPNGYR